MNDLISKVLEAHGGEARWNSFKTIEATIVSSGKLFDQKGFPQDPSPRTMTVGLHEQYASMHPFGAPDRKTNFRPTRIAVESLSGQVVSERKGSVDDIHHHMTAEQWDGLDRAYFNGYAIWTYFTTPFFLLMKGVKAVETGAWIEGKETWRGLRVEFSPEFATHSSVQALYFGEDYLLRRHDYLIDIAGTFDATQYVYDMKETRGFKFPSKRRAYKKGPDGKPLLDELMVSIDVENVHFF